MPEELADAFRIQQWGPPDGGGWLDWDAAWLNRMEQSHNAWKALTSWRAAHARYKGKQLGEWKQLNPSIVEAVLIIEGYRSAADGHEHPTRH